MTNGMSILSFLYQAFLQKIEPCPDETLTQPTRWLRIGQAANGMDFDCVPELPYRDIAPLDWNSKDGFTELDGTGKAFEQWIPLHESKPQVHTIYRLGKRLYRLGYAMPVKEGRIYAVHVQHGAFWVEPR